MAEQATTAIDHALARPALPGPRLAATVALLVTALIWGAMMPMTFSIGQHLQPLVMASLRFLIAIPPLYLLYLVTDKAPSRGGPVPWGRVLLLGGGVAGFTFGYTFGVIFTDPVRGAIVMSCSPLTAVIVSWLLLKSPLVKGFWPAAACAIAGAAIVAVESARLRGGSGGSLLGTGFAPRELLGIALFFAAQASWSWYSVRVQSWLAPLGWSQMRIGLYSNFSGGLIALVVFAMLLGSDSALLPGSWPPFGAVAMLVWIGIGSAGLATLLWNYGVSHTGVAIATLTTNLAPVFSVLVAALFFGAAVSGLQIAGGLLILAGVVSMQWRQLRGRR